MDIYPRVKEEAVIFERIRGEVGKVIVGQRYLIDRLIIALLCNEHVLIEGVPGLAKTLTVKTLSSVMHLGFSRIQFTPDLLPSDLIGTVIYNQKDGEFVPKKGPIFGNIILADEINRAPAKVQSALLQAMQERQVTLGDVTYPLDEPFLVLATQNPIELEGTYPLPEAQLDRFMMKLCITYPTRAEEVEVMERMARASSGRVFTSFEEEQRVIYPEEVKKARAIVDEIRIEESIKDYIVRLVTSTRKPEDAGIDELSGMIEYGSSPRGSIFLSKAARAHAFLNERGYVLPEDVKVMAKDVLRHRIILSYEAQAKGMTADGVIDTILSRVRVP
jgi:MoxR-like ATPase